MIQVITRTFKLLEEMALDGMVSLESLARTGDLNKGTLCNILKTLIELGYVERCSRGRYRLSENFRNLCSPVQWDPNLTIMMQRHTEKLADELRESIVISSIRNNRVSIIAQSQYQRNLMINEVICYARLSLYHSVSGRIVISYLPPEQRKKLFDSCGAPGEAWENAGDFESFETATATIRERELSVMTNEDEGIKSFAVPIFDPDRKICASLALTLPISQLAADGGSSLTRTLHRTSRTIAAQLGVMEFSAADFIHIV